MSKNLNDIETRSEEVQDLMGRVPSWITRNGILLVIFILVMLIAGSWFFKYPDIITASVVVTSDNPPVHLLARVDGKLTGYLKNQLPAISITNIKITKRIPFLVIQEGTLPIRS